MRISSSLLPYQHLHNRMRATPQLDPPVLLMEKMLSPYSCLPRRKKNRRERLENARKTGNYLHSFILLYYEFLYFKYTTVIHAFFLGFFRMEDMLTDLLTVTDEQQQQRLSRKVESVIVNNPRADEAVTATPSFKKSSICVKYTDLEENVQTVSVKPETLLPL